MRKQKQTQTKNLLPPDTIVIWKNCWIGRVVNSDINPKPLRRNCVRVRRLENARATYQMELQHLTVVEGHTKEELVKLIKAMNRVGADGVRALVRHLTDKPSSFLDRPTHETWDAPAPAALPIDAVEPDIVDNPQP